MKLSIGNPQSGVKIEIGPDVTEDSVREACDALRLASLVWKEWSLENETGEEKELRLAVEENQRLQKRQLLAQNSELRKMLDGKV
jgi:hypothetical protein